MAAQLLYETENQRTCSHFIDATAQVGKPRLGSTSILAQCASDLRSEFTNQVIGPMGNASKHPIQFTSSKTWKRSRPDVVAVVLCNVHEEKTHLMPNS